MIRENTRVNANPRGISRENRKLLTILHRNFPGPFSIAEAIDVLKLDYDRVARLLPYLASQGWLKRVRQGLYTVVPLEAASPDQWVKDPWALFSRVFQPGYIGGWSACHHWGLTDQLFRAVVIYTTKSIREREGSIDGTPYIAHVIGSSRLFGLSKAWREEIPVSISDPSRTIVDVLDTPALGGGIRHVGEVIESYFRSDHANEEVLLQYIEQFGNRAIYKRLGLMAERLHVGSDRLLEACRERISRGPAKLDPDGSDRGPLNRTWRVVENVKFSPER